jgi:ubiquinone/menaquinone biosynthesis methyltransferase
LPIFGAIERTSDLQPGIPGIHLSMIYRLLNKFIPFFPRLRTFRNACGRTKFMTSSPYYRAGPERASRVRALFDRIAPRYDLINDLQSFGLHRFWKRRLLSLTKIRPGTPVLDVCCGTGDLAFGLAAQGARVIGCDFSRRMLAVAQGRATEGSHFVQGDALVLPVKSGSFEVATIGYGLRNLADLRQGVAELLRVLKPGGQLLILDFGKPPNPLWRALYFAYLRAVVPLFGRVFCGDAAAYGYILESLRHYPAQEGVSQLLGELGCAEVEVQNVIGGIMSIHRAVKPLSLGQSHDVALVAGDLLRKG